MISRVKGSVCTTFLARIHQYITHSAAVDLIYATLHLEPCSFKALLFYNFSYIIAKITELKLTQMMSEQYSAVVVQTTSIVGAAVCFSNETIENNAL